VTHPLMMNCAHLDNGICVECAGALAREYEAEIAKLSALVSSQGIRLMAAEDEAERLREYVDEEASEPCAYGDNCPQSNTRHGMCRACKARAALHADKEPEHHA